MPRLKLQRWPLGDYRGSLTEGAWKVGEARDVSAEVAGYLLDLGGYFVRASKASKADTGARSAPVLDQSSKKAIAALKGSSPADLRDLRDIEAAGKGRKTVLKAIEAQLAEE